jgi:hypothetical protein
MAVALALNDIIRAEIISFNNKSQEGENVLHYRVSVIGVSPATTADCAKDISISVQAQIKALLSNLSAFELIRVNVLNRTPTPAPALYAADTGNGTAGAAELPGQTCGIITLRTNNAGRGQRGRIYVPFPSATDNDNNGHPTAGYQTRLANYAAAIGIPGGIAVAEGGRSATIVPTLYHRRTHNADDITSYIVRSVWASQRRRSDYGRTNVIPT